MGLWEAGPLLLVGLLGVWASGLKDLGLARAKGLSGLGKRL